MQEGESAREYADRLNAERQTAADAQHHAYEALWARQVRHDLEIVQQMAALADQLLAYNRNQPRSDMPIHAMSSVTALSQEIAERLDLLKQMLEGCVFPNSPDG